MMLIIFLLECGEHQKYSNCGPHKDCVATCRNPLAMNGPCPDNCNQGCFCDEDYVLNDKQECIPVDKCFDGQ